jgi:hypothetical protein
VTLAFLPVLPHSVDLAESAPVELSVTLVAGDERMRHYAHRRVLAHHYFPAVLSAGERLAIRKTRRQIAREESRQKIVTLHEIRRLAISDFSRGVLSF